MDRRRGSACESQGFVGGNWPRLYPAQLANAQAVLAGEKTWECEIDGAAWHQRTFPYQAKCLQWTRDHYTQLSATDRARVDALIAGTGIDAMLVAG